MELELNRTHLAGYEAVLDTELFQEETLETIVPDACPDILRLVDTQGTALLKSKTAMDGRVTLTGTARLTVLYLPEGGEHLCSLEVNVPFSISAEGKNVRSGCAVTACAWVAGADTRTVNPRKIMTRVEIAVRVKVFAESAVSLCAGIGAEEGTVEQLTQTVPVYCVCAVPEKQFSFEDNVAIPAGRPAAEELLASRTEPVCVEAKLIGNKLIVKGEVAVRLLYRSSGGTDTAELILPFSQIIEVTGAGEDATCAVETALLAADFTLGEDGRTVAVSMSMLAQAVVRETRSVPLLADAYSTCCQLLVERVPFEYDLCRTDTVGRQSLRESIESGLPIRSVIDAYCRIGRTELTRQAGEAQLSAQVTVTVLCVTEDGEYAAVSRVLPVSCAVELPEECGGRFHCRCGSLTASPTADGVEVRAAFEFPCLGWKRVQTWAVRDVSVGESADNGRAERASVILRTLREGERLWDVAKEYGAAIGDIVKASELENEQPCAGTLLLIPGKR